MKKIYILVFTIVFSINSIAQIASKNLMMSEISKSFYQAEYVHTSTPFSLENSVNSLGNVIWESDFTNNLDWTIDNTGTFTNEGWNIDANMDSWYLPAFSSTSGGSFAELGNGDPNGNGNWPVGVEYTLTTAAPINIYDSIGSGNATLSFEEFGARFNDLQAIQVSIDGVNFTTIGDNLDYTVTSEAAGSNPYPNPSLREINLAPYIGSMPNQVWIRFSWTTNFPTQGAEPNVWITYGWCIDDVKISESPSNKITMEDEVIGGYWLDYLNYIGAGLNDIIGLDYSVSPLSQITNHPYAIEAVFRNEGTSSQTVELSYDVTGTAASYGGSNSSVLNAGDSVILGASFTPSVVGQYSIDIWGVADSAGAGITTTLSNMETREIEVTDYIYGKDLGEANSTGSWIVGGPGDLWHLTTRYEMYANEQLYSVRAFITDESVVGGKITAIIYEADSTAASGVAFYEESDPYFITSADLGSWVDIPFFNPLPLLNGFAYEIGIVGTNHPTDSVFVGTSGESMYNGEHSVYDEDGLNPNEPADVGVPTWYYITSTPMIRMNFDPASSTPQTFNCIGVSCIDPGDGTGMYPTFSACENICNPTGIIDSELKVSIYPNPTDGILVVELDGSSDYDITIYNVLGQAVLTTSTNLMINSFDLSSFDKGLYSVEIKNSNTNYIERVIVE